MFIAYTDASVKDEIAQFHSFSRGVILFDSKAVKKWLHNRGRNSYKKLLRKVARYLRELEIKTQLIPRALNIAHHICYKGNYRISTSVSSIKRDLYEAVGDYPDFYLSLRAFDQYISITKRKGRSFHYAQRKLNMNTWLGRSVNKSEDITEYAFHDLIIIVKSDTILSVKKVSNIDSKYHWRVAHRKKKLKKLIQTGNSQ